MILCMSNNVYGHTKNILKTPGIQFVTVNKFSKNNLENTEILNSVMTYCRASNTYIKVFVSTSGKFSDLKECSLKNVVHSTSDGYLIDSAGYKMLELSEPQGLNSDEFLVGIQYNNYYNNLMPVETSISSYCGAKVEDNQSFYADSIEDMKNGNYVDCNKNGRFNACIKAFIKESTPIERIWNFSNDKFDDMRYTNISETKEYDGLKINATTDYVTKIIEGNKYISGHVYPYSLVLKGGNNLGKSSSDGTIEIDVSGPTEIYVAAKTISGNGSPDAYIYL